MSQSCSWAEPKILTTTELFLKPMMTKYGRSSLTVRVEHHTDATQVAQLVRNASHQQSMLYIYIYIYIYILSLTKPKGSSPLKRDLRGSGHLVITDYSRWMLARSLHTPK